MAMPLWVIGADPQRQLGEELRRTTGIRPMPDAHRYQQLVAAVGDVSFLKDLDAGGRDHAEHGNRRTAEHRRWNRGHQVSAALGNRLSTIRNAPAMIVTERQRTPVICTRPMFWANEEWVKVFKKPAKNDAPASHSKPRRSILGDTS